MSRIAFNAPGAATVGPYSHAVLENGFLFLSGQTPIDPDTGQLVVGSVADQTRQCFANLGAVLVAAGLSFADVIKCSVYLTDLADFAEMNMVYAEQFAQPYPARTTIGVRELPLNAQIEIELIARTPTNAGGQ